MTTLLTMTEAGRVTLARAVHDYPITLAVGTGDPAWDEASLELDGAERGLITPLAMVRARRKAFVTQDDVGDIELSDGSRWRVSAAPTKFLYVSFTLGFQDDPDAELRERAVYLQTAFAAEVPPGRTYVPWADVDQPGNLLAMTRMTAIRRSGVRDTFDDVMTF